MNKTIEVLQIGQKVGVFEILCPLHRGGQAIVYLARPWQPGKMSREHLLQRIERQDISPQLIEQQQLCAIKVANPDSVEHLLNEWDFLQQPNIRHDRLIETFSQRFPYAPSRSANSRRANRPAYVDLPTPKGTVESVPYLVLAYEPGGSLKQLFEMRNYKPLEPACAVQVAIQVGEALQHLHETARIVHHDVTPSNILLRQRPLPFRGSAVDVLLTDLAAADSLENPRLRQVFGKRLYLPPERLNRAAGSVSPQIDIYGLGMVLYEMLVGRLRDQTTQELSNVDRRLEPINTRARVSDELNAIIMAAIERDVAQRRDSIPTMRDMVAMLRKVPEAQKSCRLRGPWEPVDRQRVVIAAMSAVVVLVLGVFILGAVVFIAPTFNGAPPDTVIATSVPDDEPTVTPLPPTETPVINSTVTPGPTATPIPATSPTAPPTAPPTATPIPGTSDVAPTIERMPPLADTGQSAESGQ